MMKLTTDQFVAKARAIHGDKYDYSSVEYINTSTAIKIVCYDHGLFLQPPNRHLSNHGCPKCGYNTICVWGRLSQDEFIAKAKIVHNNKYDYSQVIYCNSKNYVTIICEVHGGFKQIPNAHLNGKGCPKCARLSISHTTDEFIAKAKSIHGDKYDYSLVSYTKLANKVCIICPKHGRFLQKPLYHFRRGCTKCSIELVGQSQMLTKERFIDRANKTHNGKYDYSLMNRVVNDDKIIIICPIHGQFKQNCSNHLYRGAGCPRCGQVVQISSTHKKLSDDISILVNNVVLNDQMILKPYEIDIWLPDYKLGIECHGAYRHSCVDGNSRFRLLHQKKADKAVDTDINLLQFFETEIRFKYDTIIDIIKSKLKICDTIHARLCSKNEISPSTSYDFVNRHHLQGGRFAKINLALVYRDEIVMCLTINKHNKYDYEIIRLTTKPGIVVVGGASKLFNMFVKIYKPNSVITFADRRYSNGNVYLKLGFKMISTTQPNYFYFKNNKLYSRISFQKHKLFKKLPIFNSQLSESQNMFNNGYRKLYDAGHLKFVWTVQ